MSIDLGGTCVRYHIEDDILLPNNSPLDIWIERSNSLLCAMCFVVYSSLATGQRVIRALVLIKIAGTDYENSTLQSRR